MQQLLQTPIQYIKGVGPKKAESFQKLGIKTAGDLLEFYPRTYEDWSKTAMIALCHQIQPCYI